MKSLNQIETMISGRRSRPHVRSKRGPKVNYPWIRKPYTCSAKAFIAHLIDHDKSINTSVKNERDKKTVFHQQIYPRLLSQFPKLYRLVKKYYRKRGRKLTRKHFRQLAYARLINMYEQGFKVRTKEHPLNSTNKMLRDAYGNFNT